MKNKFLTLFMLVILLPMALFAAGKMKKNSKVILSGNILANSQIVPVGGQAKTVMGAGSGKVRFSSTLYCGDGDVAHYQARNSDVSFYGILTPKINTEVSAGTWKVTQNMDVSNLTTNIVMGYWVSPEGGSLDTSPAKFFSIGYTKSSKVDSDVTEKLTPPNFTGIEKQNFVLIEDAMKDMAIIAKTVNQTSASGLSHTKYNMKFVAMACPVIKNAGGVDSTSGLNNLKITRQFITGAKLVGGTNLKDYMLNSSLDSNGRLAKSQFKVDGSGSADFTKSIDLDFNSSSGENLSGSLVSAINNLANAPLPPVTNTNVSVTYGVSPTTTVTCDCQKIQYDSYLASVRSAHETFKTRMGQARGSKSICDAGSGISFTSTDYPWEVFRTNAACQMYHKVIGEELAAYESAMGSLFGVASLNTDTCGAVAAAASSSGSCPGNAVSKVTPLTPAEFEARKLEINKKLMKLVGTPNAIQVAQDKLKERITANAAGFALNTAACFPIDAGSGEYIKHISSSVGIHVSPDPAASGSLVLTIDPGAVSHPEGNFAIGGDAPYLDGNGNNHILFNNPPIGDPVLTKAFKVEVGMSDALAITTGTANVQFHIRTIGCSKNIYCYNDR